MSVRGWLMKLRARADVRPLPAAATAAPPLRAMTGKYVLLYEYLEHRHADTVVLTFAEIEDLLGFALPDQARGHREWWTDAAASMKDSYSTAVKGAQDYNTKFIEFARTNTETALDFAQKLWGVKSPSDFIELSTEHSRKQFETLTQQTSELAALAQKVTLAAVEPLKTSVSKTFSTH